MGVRSGRGVCDGGAGHAKDRETVMRCAAGVTDAFNAGVGLH